MFTISEYLKLLGRKAKTVLYAAVEFADENQMLIGYVTGISVATYAYHTEMKREEARRNRFKFWKR